MTFERLRICTDAMEHAINWTKREDRRNVVLAALASVGSETGYCFAIYLDFDPSVDMTKVAGERDAHIQVNKPVPLRRHARLWLQANFDDAAARSAVRASRRHASPPPPPGLAGEIDDAYGPGATSDHLTAMPYDNRRSRRTAAMPGQCQEGSPREDSSLSPIFPSCGRWIGRLELRFCPNHCRPPSVGGAGPREKPAVPYRQTLRR